MSQLNLKNIVEAALLAAGRPLSIDNLLGLFPDGEKPERRELKEVLGQLGEDYADRGIELKEVASGWRIQVRKNLGEWISRLWQERSPRYSRALLETLAIIAYRQPVTRGDVEEIRGVSITTNIMRTLLDRSWVRVVGHRDVPGKPALYGTTKEFLDYFGLRRLEDLPPLAEIMDLDSLNVELDLEEPEAELAAALVVADEEARAAAAEASESREAEPDAGAGEVASVDAGPAGTPEHDEEAADEGRSNVISLAEKQASH